ncbi:hypothetical protein BMI85_08305 [Thioclava sp. DLFJ4-1]|nr:hypothetical protein BMI85_08305 [Thioclava sp. DLFJ4-1]
MAAASGCSRLRTHSRWSSQWISSARRWLVANSRVRRGASTEDHDNETVDQRDIENGMSFEMVIGWLFGLLILVLVVLTIAALIKCLQK